MNNKDNEKFIEKLSNGQYNLTISEKNELIKEKNNNKKRSNIIFNISLFIIALLVVVTMPAAAMSFARYSSTAVAQTTIQVAKWKIAMKFNNNTWNSIPTNVDLASTITTNNYSMTKVVPGTRGHFTIELDFTGTEVGLNYMVGINKATLPANLKFYSDASFQILLPNQDLTNISYTDFPAGATTNYLSHNQTATSKTIDIYWKWVYTETNENSLQNTNVFANVIVFAKQNV